MSVIKAVGRSIESLLKANYGPDFAGAAGRAASIRQGRMAQAGQDLFGPTVARRRKRGRMTTLLSQGEDTGLGG